MLKRSHFVLRNYSKLILSAKPCLQQSTSACIEDQKPPNKIITTAHTSYESCPDFTSTSPDDLNFSWEVDLEPEQKENLAKLKCEYIIWSSVDEDIPTYEHLNQSNWLTLLDAKSAEERLYYYYFLRRKLSLKAKLKSQKLENRIKWNERTQDDNRTGLEYGFKGGNFIFQRIENGVVTKWRESRFPNIFALNPPLVIDLSLFNYQEYNKDVNLTAKQLRLSYDVNFLHRQPFHLIFTGYDPSASWAAVLNKHFSFNGIENYTACSVTRKSYMELFPPEKLIYLSPDAPTALKTFDSDKVHIVGALVDKTQTQKNLTLGIAKRLGIACRKLPLDDYVKWEVGKKSLVVNHVVNILLDVHLTSDWRSSLLCTLPTRHLKPVPPENTKKRREMLGSLREKVNYMLTLTNLT